MICVNDRPRMAPAMSFLDLYVAHQVTTMTIKSASVNAPRASAVTGASSVRQKYRVYSEQLTPAIHVRLLRTSGKAQ